METRDKTTTTRELACKLDDNELHEFTEKFAEKDNELEQARSDAKAVAAEHKAKIDQIQVDRDKLRSVVINKMVDRQIECTWEADWKAKQWKLVRNDTKQVIVRETMSKEDLQGNINLQAGMKKEKGKKKPGKSKKKGK